MSTSPSPPTPAASGGAASGAEAAPSGRATRTSPADVHEVRFVAYPKLLFTWPLIFAGYAFALFAGALNPEALETLGWFYITITVVVILALGVDVGRNQAIFWLVVILALWFLGLWLRDVKQIPVFGSILGWFAGMDVRYDRGFGLALSVVLTVPFVIMIAWAHVNDRWRITHNEFEHYSFGRMDDSLGRGAKTIRTEFPDLFELLLGGAGTLIVYNATGTQELRRIPHVMFLPWVRARLNKVLERMAVTSTDAAITDSEENG